GGDEHLLAVDAHGAQRDLDGTGARVDRDGVVDAEVGGEPLLELATQLAQGELPGGQALVDLLEDGRPVFRWEVHRSGRDSYRSHSGTCTDIGMGGWEARAVRRDAGAGARALRPTRAPDTTLCEHLALRSHRSDASYRCIRHFAHTETFRRRPQCVTATSNADGSRSRHAALSALTATSSSPSTSRRSPPTRP